MTKSKPELYFHQPTGEIMYATKAQAKKLNPEWHKVQFVKNDKGMDVMRFSFTDARGATATVDVSDNGTQEIDSDGNGQPE